MEAQIHEEPKIESRAKRDLLIIFVLAAALYLYMLFSNYDVFETIAVFVEQHDHWELDEILMVGLFLTICFAVYSWRRLVEVQNYEMLLEKQNLELKKALQEIKTLQGLVPICSSCKKIRDDKGYWHQVESYVAEHTMAHFTHGICPECMQKLYPELSGGHLKPRPSQQARPDNHN